MQALVPPKFVRLFLILSDAFTKGSDTTIDSAVLLVPGYDLFQKNNVGSGISWTIIWGSRDRDQEDA